MKQIERQAHGFIFQNWVIGKFLDMAYTAKWDIPAKINPMTNKNISIKTAQWKSSVGLGDALNQFGIDEDFEMLVAFYVQNDNRKLVVNMQSVEISKEKWRELWGNMTREKLVELQNFIKSKKGRGLKGAELDEFRELVQGKKRELLADYDGKLSLNPKIDSGVQRRLQCSISFNILFEEFNLDKNVMETYRLWKEDIDLRSVKLE
ncbi:MAG: hypothetical protein KJ592_02530 [Nanoarchaeota archaeon]|nr:hypothetical protein [Nanoarchaeota archaeon]